LHEVEAILELAELLEYLSVEDLNALKAARDGCAKLVYGLLRKMAKSATSA